MRIGLISALKRTETGELRSSQELAGRIVLEWQVDLALAVGCERILCLGDTALNEGLAQQKRIEDMGLSFHFVRGPLQFTGLVRPDDELFMQLDGLTIGGGALDMVESSSDPQSAFILALLADHSLSQSYPEDFERIDRDRHWAGVALISGNCVANLETAPVDADVMSILLRIGLQSRIACKVITQDLLEDDQWLLALDAQTVERRSHAIMEASLSQSNWAGLGNAIATRLVRATAPSWLGKGSEFSSIAAIFVMGVALFAALYNYLFTGLCLAVLGAFLGSLAAASLQLREGISTANKATYINSSTNGIIAMLSCIILTLANSAASNIVVQAAVPMLAVGLLWLASQVPTPSLRAFWSDMPGLLAAFATAFYFDLLEVTLLVSCLAALLQLVLRERQA